MRVSLFSGRVARWSVSVALCQSILRIRLVVCVGRDAKERGLERPRLSDVTLNFEDRHENKSCSACPKDQHKHF